MATNGRFSAPRLSKIRLAILALFVPVLTVTPAVSVRANIDNASTAMVVTQLVRQFTIRNTVNSVQQSLQGQVSAVSGTNVLRAPPMGLPDSFFPAGVGTVPLGYNLPQFDGGGRMLGYCAWDNTASVGDSNYLAGASIANKKLFAVISPGLDGNLQTDCDHALVSSLAVGDDYMVVVAPPQASFSQFRSSVPTLAALSTTPGVAGDVRLVEENNQLYSYLAGTWQALKADEKFGDDPASGTGAISYTTGKVTVAEFQASAASIVGDLNVGGASVFTGSITANANLTVAGTTTLNGDAIVAGDLSIAGAFTAGALAGDGGALTNLNASAVTSGILSVARGGTGLDGSAAGPGALLIGNGSGFSVGNIVAGDGVSVTQSSGSITIENAGVTKFNGRSGVVNLNFDDVNAAVSGSMGVRLGVGALARNTTGSGNVALGALTLNFNYGGSQNVAIGHQAMTSHSPTGSTAVGYQAHYSGNGSFNAAFGRNTLLYPNGGSHNTAIGNEALTNTAAGYNVGLGSQAGLANTTGTFNTFLGYRSNISGIDQLTYATAIGANSLVGTSNTIVLGRTTDTTVIGATGTATNGILQNKILQVTGDVGITGNVSIGGTFTASGFVGNGSGLTNLNAGNISTGIVSVARGGTGVDGSAAANGALLIGNGSGFALGMLNGTANQISVTNDPGSITLALPQDISPTSTPTFGGMVLHGPLAAQEATISGNLRTGRLFFTNSASNVVIGQNSLNNPESGYYNIAIGDYVMPGNISGFNNIGIGNGAQNCNETGHSNIALGYETLNCLQSGDLNTAVGTSALYSTDGLGNTGIGARAMSSNHTGNENTALGFYAGSQRGNDYAARQRYGSNNTYLGAYAHPTVDNLSYATVIGSDASVSTSNTVVLGRASDVVVLGATGDDGSGNRLQVNGNARFTGNVDFNSLSVSGVPATLAFRYASDTGSEFYAEPNLGLGQGALASRKSAGNVALGDGVLGQMNTLGWGDESGSWNTGVGYQALYKNDYGDENSALGYKTLYENTSGYYNVAVGGWSLYSNTSGYLNTAIGYQALYANTTARRNVAVGGYALSANTEGSDNTAVGYNAMGYTGITSFNTAVGRAAMSYLSTGNSNTAIGRRSGDFLDTGSNNTFIGEYAGFGASTSNNNIAIGRYSQIADNLDRATVIGTDAYVATSNTMVLGGSTQVVVIGSSSDDGSGNKLQVSGGIRASGNAIFNTGNPGHYTQLRDLRIMSSGDDAQWDHLRVRTDGVSSVIDAGGAENGLIFRVGQGASGGIGDQSYNTVLSLFPDQSAVFSGRIQVADRLSFSSINGNRILLWGDNHGFGINTSNLSAFVPAGGNYFSIREGSYNGPEHFSVNPSGNWIRLGGTATDQMIYIGRNDPGGGGGDQAYMRYYVRSGEATTFALGNPNDGDDHIALLPGGNVGIGTAEPQYKLDVVGDVRGSRYLSAIGDRNFLAGPNTMVFNTTGSDNIAMGNYAMFFNSTGRENVAINAAALYNNSSGSYNTALGRESLSINTVGNYNSALGAFTNVLQNNLSYATAIGAWSRVSTSNTLVLGRTIDTTVIGATGDDGSGNKLQVSGTASVRGEGDRPALNAYTNGAQAWGVVARFVQTAVGNSDGPKIEFYKPFSSGGVNWTAGIAAGTDAGDFVFSSGAGTTSSGFGTPRLSISSTGVVNLTNSLHFSNSLGNKVLLWGNGSGADDYGFGINNGNLTAFVPAGGNYFSIREGSYNGAEHFSVNPSGNWIRLGGTATDQMIYIGRNDPGGGGGDQAYMRYHARTGEATSLTLGVGNDADDHIALMPSGNVGVGTFDPQYKFDVAGTLHASGRIYASAGTEVTTGQLMRFGVAHESTDTVGIYRTNPASDQALLRIAIGDNSESFLGVAADELQIGRMESNGNYTPVFRIAGNGDTQVSGYVQATAFNTSSDRRLKTNLQVQDDTSVLNRLEQLKTYSYQYIDNPGLGRRIGVIAQEVQQLFPEVVAIRPDGLMSVDYSALGAMAAMGVGKLSMQFKSLEKDVIEHDKRLTELDGKVLAHDKRLETLEAWKSGADKRMDGLQSAIDLNISKIAEHALAIQSNQASITRLEEVIQEVDKTLQLHAQHNAEQDARWKRHFSESADGAVLTVQSVELKVSNLSAERLRAKALYTERLEVEMARIMELEVNNLRANTATARNVQAETVNTGSAQVYAGVGAPAFLFAAPSDGHYTVSTSAMDGSYATATVIVNAGQAKVVSVANEGIELYAEGNQVKALAAGKSIRASWIKTG